MLSYEPVTAILGGILVFFLPGYVLVRAVFPEWRVRGEDALRRGLEIATLSFVLSIVLTVLVGYVLLQGSPNGFEATWSQPVLEVSLAAVALVAFGAGWIRGAYRRHAPRAAGSPEPEAGEERAWNVSRELERLQREERRLLRHLRTRAVEGSEREESERELSRVRQQVGEIQRQREAEYAR